MPLHVSKNDVTASYGQGAGIFNVMTYGAKGDGVHDDLPAFNAAVSAAYAYGRASAAPAGYVAGGTVLMPPGYYILSGTLDLSAGDQFGSLSVSGSGTARINLEGHGRTSTTLYWVGPGMTGSDAIVAGSYTTMKDFGMTGVCRNGVVTNLVSGSQNISYTGRSSEFLKMERVFARVSPVSWSINVDNAIFCIFDSVQTFGAISNKRSLVIDHNPYDSVYLNCQFNNYYSKAPAMDLAGYNHTIIGGLHYQYTGSIGGQGEGFPTIMLRNGSMTVIGTDFSSTGANTVYNFDVIIGDASGSGSAAATIQGCLFPAKVQTGMNGNILINSGALGGHIGANTYTGTPRIVINTGSAGTSIIDGNLLKAYLSYSGGALTGYPGPIVVQDGNNYVDKMITTGSLLLRSPNGTLFSASFDNSGSWVIGAV